LLPFAEWPEVPRAGLTLFALKMLDVLGCGWLTAIVLLLLLL